MSPAPLQLEHETAEYFRRTLAATKEGMESALVWSPVQEGSDPESGIRCRFEGPAVVLGWYKKGQRPKESFFDLCGFAVSIMPSTLQHIEEKKITRVKLDTGFPKGPPHWHVLKVG